MVLLETFRFDLQFEQYMEEFETLFDVSLWSYVLLQWLLDFPRWTLGVKKLWIATRKLSCFGFTALTHYLFSCYLHTNSKKNVWYVYYVNGINLKLKCFCNFIEMPRRKFLWMSTWKQKSPKVPNLPSWYKTFFKNNIQVECMPKPVIFTKHTISLVFL